MDIKSLIDRPNNSVDGNSPSATSSPIERRHTLSSLLNEDDEDPIDHQSRKNSIILSTLNSKPLAAAPKSTAVRKPKRYDIPPIWATSWKKAYAKNNTSKVNGSLGRRAPATLSGLPTSITNVTPYEDLTRKITEWLFSNILELGDEKQYIEVEFKFGKICTKSNDQRLTLPVITETVLRPDYTRAETFFQAALSDEQFGRANTFLDELSG
jgi:hypothetical protein